MFYLRNSVAVVLFQVLFAAAAMSQTPQPLSQEDDQAIRKTVANIERAWNTHDMKLYAAQLRDDVEWVNVKGMHWRGIKQVMDAHVHFHATIFKNHHIKTETVETRSLSNGVAIAVVTETKDGFTTPDGHLVPTTRDCLTYVLAKGPEGWKIVHGHNVEIDPAAAQFDPVNGKNAKK